MKQRENVKIDESIRVNSWGGSPSNPTNTQQQYFQKYARNLQHEQSRELQVSPPFQVQTNEVGAIEQGFRKLKNQQIDKLRNLKSEYQEIRKIATDYPGPRIGEGSSLRSSLHDHSQLESKVRAHGQGGRQTQILQLQKKQLQIMVENSMKKIQQLLHNEMEYKKAIHELKLQKESHPLSEGQGNDYSKIYKRREKQYGQQIRMLELQRQTLLSNTGALRDRVKYLESGLATSEQELRKMLEEKRNYQELIRMEKDRFMNLEIQYRREKREHEIIEKDKNSEINHLLKLRDVKEASNEKQLKATVAALQQQIKTKDKRYTLLLQQFQNFQKDRSKQERDQQAKLVTELLSKNQIDGPNKVIQEALSGIMQRLSQLQNKPQTNNIQLFERLVNATPERNHVIVQDNSALIAELQDKIHSSTKRIAALQKSNQTLNQQNYNIKLEYQNINTKNKALKASENSLKEDVQRLENQVEKLQLYLQRFQNQVKLKKTQTKEKVYQPPPTPQPQIPQRNDISFNPNFYISKINNLEAQIKHLNQKLQQNYKQRNKLDDQNRSLLVKANKIQFEYQKTKKQAQFQIQMLKRTQQLQIQSLNQELNHYRQLHNRQNNQTLNLKQQLQSIKNAGTNEINHLKRTIQNIQKQNKILAAQLNSQFNGDFTEIQEEHQSKILELTSNIQKITELNKRLQEELQKCRGIENQNVELRTMIMNAGWSHADIKGPNRNDSKPQSQNSQTRPHQNDNLMYGEKQLAQNLVSGFFSGFS